MRSDRINSRAASAIATMDEGDDDEDGSSTESDNTLAFPPQPTKASQPTPMHTPFFARIRQRMAWGTTTREEKRSLWSDKASKSNYHRSKRKAHYQPNVSVPTEMLLGALRRRLHAAGDAANDEEVAELSALLRLHFRHEILEASLWLVDAFDVLSSDGCGGSTAATPTGGATPSREYSFGAAEEGAVGGSPLGASAAIEALSDRFIDGLCALMQRLFCVA